MTHSAKYLIHADVRANGVVERSDVVGAIFGQTEGLLGDGLDLRDLQEASKVGRIDVNIESEGGRTFGTITIASRLDKAETAVLGAALETIERVGPCRAECTVTHIEDARAAKRRELVDRATDLLGDLDETTLSSEDLVDEVRQQARVDDITEYRGVPAGPRVEESDAIIVVEGRADVRNLLRYGVRNAIAVEGTDVPDAVARLTTERTTTAFLDGDRGGDLILRELTQVGDVDYVAFAPGGESVEDLDRSGIDTALRKKLPVEQVAEGRTARETFDGDLPTDEEDVIADGATAGVDPTGETAESTAEATLPAQAPRDEQPPQTDGETRDDGDAGPADEGDGEQSGNGESADGTGQGEHGGDSLAVQADDGGEERQAAEEGETGTEDDGETTRPQTLAGHVEEAVGEGSGHVRVLDDSFDVLAEGNDGTVLETGGAWTAIVDGPVTQRLLDVAAQRGLAQVVGTSTGEFVKRPTSVRVRTADEILGTVTQ